MPRPFFAREIVEGRLRTVLDGWVVASGSLHAVYSSVYHLTATVCAFLDFLGERVEPSLWTLDGGAHGS